MHAYRWGIAAVGDIVHVRGTEDRSLAGTQLARAHPVATGGAEVLREDAFGYAQRAGGAAVIVPVGVLARQPAE